MESEARRSYKLFSYKKKSVLCDFQLYIHVFIHTKKNYNVIILARHVWCVNSYIWITYHTHCVLYYSFHGSKVQFYMAGNNGIFYMTASQVNIIVVKHSWFRIGFWVQGDQDWKAAELPGHRGTRQRTFSKERRMLSSPA